MILAILTIGIVLNQLWLLYKNLIHKSVSNFIQSGKKSEIKLSSEKIELLNENPILCNNLDFNKMFGKDNVFRLRIGKFRFPYQIEEKEMVIINISRIQR